MYSLGDLKNKSVTIRGHITYPYHCAHWDKLPILLTYGIKNWYIGRVCYLRTPKTQNFKNLYFQKNLKIQISQNFQNTHNLKKNSKLSQKI